MIPLDWCVLFFSGMLVVLLNYKEIRNLYSPILYNSFFPRLFIWYIWFIIGTLPFYLLYPDWMWAYFIKPSTASFILGAVFFYFFTFAFFFAGYLSMAVIVREESKKARAGGVLLLLAFALILAVMAIAGLWEQFWTVTSYEGFHSGVKEPVKYKELFWKIYAVAGVLMVWMFNWIFSLQDKFAKRKIRYRNIDSTPINTNRQDSGRKELII